LSAGLFCALCGDPTMIPSSTSWNYEVWHHWVSIWTGGFHKTGVAALRSELA
jgi:hypothetical protein